MSQTFGWFHRQEVHRSVNPCYCKHSTYSVNDNVMMESILAGLLRGMMTGDTCESAFAVLPEKASSNSQQQKQLDYLGGPAIHNF